MKKIVQELQHFVKASTYGTASDRALLLDYQATLEPQTEKAIKLEKEALAQIKESQKKMPTLFPTSIPILEDFTEQTDSLIWLKNA